MGLPTPFLATYRMAWKFKSQDSFLLFLFVCWREGGSSKDRIYNFLGRSQLPSPLFHIKYDALTTRAHIKPVHVEPSGSLDLLSGMKTTLSIIVNSAGLTDHWAIAAEGLTESDTET